LKIAVNTRLLLKGKMEGIGWVSFEVLKRMTRNHPEHQFYFIFDREPHPDFLFDDNVIPVVAFPQARHPFLYYIWFEFAIPRILKRIGADLFFSPDGYLSLRANITSINVFHDLNVEHRPMDVPFWERKFYKYFFPKYANKATKIIAVSEFTKSDVIQRYNVDESKIGIAYNGANEAFKAIDDIEKKKVRKEYTNGKEYFVFVGAFNPRKNLVNLFKAFDLFKKQDDKHIKLLVVGEKMYWTKEIQEVYSGMEFKQDVIFTGRLSMDLLIKVLGSALALTYVSYLEGFGIPIIEAFRAEIPVITSNVTSMPEVAGDAALLIDPYNITSISEAMINISEDENLRKELVEKGKRRAEIFTWDKSAEKMWGFIAEMMENK